MPIVALPGVDLHYEIGGSGPPLILIAGMISDSASWAPIVGALEERFTVIRPDNRTCGRTRPLNAPAGLAEWAGDMVALMNHVGIDSAHVAGHSLGGLIALQLAAMAPTRIRRLALLASAPINRARNQALFRHLLALRGPGMPPDLWLHGLFPWLFHPRFFDDPANLKAAVAQSLAYPHAQGADAMAHQVASLDSLDTLDLPEPMPPTLAILGGLDLLMPAPMIRDTLRGVTFVELPDAGHSVHWDAPVAVVAALTQHLEAS